MAKELSTRVARLSEIYDNYSTKDVVESQSEIFTITNDSKTQAINKARALYHTQKHERKLVYEPSVSMFESKELSEEFIDEQLQSHYIRVLNNYIQYVQSSPRSEGKMKALIIYLMTNNLYVIISELDFNDKYREKVNLVMMKILERRNELSQKLIDYFESAKCPKHAEATRKAGLKVLEIRTDKAIPKYYSGIDGEIRPYESYEFIQSLRAQYLSVTESIKQNDLQRILDISQENFRTMKNRIIAELRDITPDADSIYIDNLLTGQHGITN